MVDSGALEEVRVELIDGLLCDMSPPSAGHDAAVVYLNARLVQALDCDRYQVRPQMGLTIGDSAPRPDVAVVRMGTPQPYYPSGAELVIEVSRGSIRRDLVVKPPVYAWAAIPQFWVIDLDRSRAVVHREPSVRAYRSSHELGRDGMLDLGFIGAGAIRVADVFDAANVR